MGTTLDVRVKRAGKVYRDGEILSGVVVITSKDTVQHQGISLTMEGSVNLQLSAKNVGVFEAFCNTAKPIQIISSTIEMVKPGKLPSGKTEIPFEFPLQMKGNKVLYETYHGVFVNIQYTLRCDLRRSLLAKDLTKTCEFIVHSLSQKGKLLPSPVDFTITPETLQNVKERASLPKFLIRGHLNSTNCVITQPLTGELQVESAEAAVRSIELQLGVLRAMPGTPRRSRTSRSPTATSAGASPSPSTWCSPGSSPAPPWRPPTSKWSLK
ncbi:vacuolar protein sorting-associated protein 26C isoform X2 [Zonotrichia leucophrys gambelii]|uniref:vacuolar protein sorting-associated protein 26C isoform X2 n=1 Tax=Zonotrichia leucophrys gambelii TaxID=257770 RepID=UPI00313FED3F